MGELMRKPNAFEIMMKQNPFTGAWEHKKTIKKDEKATTPSGSKKQPPKKSTPKTKKDSAQK